MTSGIPLSDQEQLYILKWVGKKSWGEISKDLEISFGVKRNQKALSRWHRQFIESSESIQLTIPKQILKKIDGENKGVLSFLFIATIENYLLMKSV